MKKVKTQKRNVVKGTACNGIDCKLNHIGVCNKFECDMVAFQPHLHHDLTPLISLCKSCHAKTNTNRDYWKDYFKKLKSK